MHINTNMCRFSRVLGEICIFTTVDCFWSVIMCKNRLFLLFLAMLALILSVGVKQTRYYSCFLYRKADKSQITKEIKQNLHTD